ncbi:unnamed protein product [Microthlaspi erraticum]|uniref:Retrovirus-related Pol polyprotein from transposon TNT 1-94-like beta-barrel domain-containing protein n=1 Tax=Microthlaspi erraticum TaxID=1685480 RepID=A0A6D2JHB1_9BRAS|nr:unnamed protein product [Microthlaspi erraticum]
MKICETFTVNCFIEKLPPGWADFKNYLAFKQKALTLANLVSRLQNESLKREKAETSPSPPIPKEEIWILREVQSLWQGWTSRSRLSQQGQGEKPSQLDRGSDMVAVVTEANMVEENPALWWYDTGATTHICIDRQMFSTYQKSKGDDRLLMGNVSHSKIEGTGKVVLKMTSGRELTLNNVKHVPDMRKNLISGTLMSKHGFAINFESDQLILRKHGVFIGKGFVKDGLIKMCVSPVQRNMLYLFPMI